MQPRTIAALAGRLLEWNASGVETFWRASSRQTLVQLVAGSFAAIAVIEVWRLASVAATGDVGVLGDAPFAWYAYHPGRGVASWVVSAWPLIPWALGVGAGLELCVRSAKGQSARRHRPAEIVLVGRALQAVVLVVAAAHGATMGRTAPGLWIATGWGAGYALVVWLRRSPRGRQWWSFWTRTRGRQPRLDARVLACLVGAGFAMAVLSIFLARAAGAWGIVLVATVLAAPAVAFAAPSWRVAEVGAGGAESGAAPDLESELPGLHMIEIGAGTFEMGGTRYGDEQPVHRVTVAAFAMGATTVTRGLYRAVLRRAPATEGLYKPNWLDEADGNELPATALSWVDAARFCNALSLLAGRSPYYRMRGVGDNARPVADSTGGYRLPSEAEWEYACRAGTTTEYSFGDDASLLSEHAWWGNNSDTGSGRSAQPCGGKTPNPWGLCDMHGNVWEWCEDDWHDDYQGAPTDGRAWNDDGVSRVLRGGSFGVDYPGLLRSACRRRSEPTRRRESIGFRVVRPARRQR
ncbi:MAG: formylglycine-generating enzyme family protein [Planctomycetota bacterium]